MLQYSNSWKKYHITFLLFYLLALSFSHFNLLEITSIGPYKWVFFSCTSNSSDSVSLSLFDFCPCFTLSFLLLKRVSSLWFPTLFSRNSADRCSFIYLALRLLLCKQYSKSFSLKSSKCGDLCLFIILNHIFNTRPSVYWFCPINYWCSPL